MTVNDLYLLSPELSIAGLAVLLILVDLITGRKKVLPVVGVLGLVVPLVFTLMLWFDLDASGDAAKAGLFGTLVVDKFALFFKFLFLVVAAVTILISTEYSRKFRMYRGEFYALILLSTAGMMLLASTKELITIYVSLELTSLPLAALAAFLKDSKSSESGLKFLIIGAISSAVLLYGMVLVYGFTGTTSLDEIAVRLGSIQLDAGTPFGSPAILMGIVLIIAGFGFKISSVPFQMWAPDVYEGAPTPITGFLSVASKAAGFAVILRVFYLAFSADFFSLDWGIAFAVMSILSMALGNLVAIRQNNIKRMLAYSTIAQAGYILVGVAAVAARTQDAQLGVGPTGVLFYLAGYAVTNLLAFSVIIAITNRINSDMIDDFAGMRTRSPYLAAVLGLSMISLMGVPPTVGFMAKIYIFGAAVNTNLEWLALAGVVNSVVSAYYYLRVVKVMYLMPSPTEERITAGFPMHVAVAITFSGVLFFGLYPTPLIQVASSAAKVLLS